jgi:hypothetical protein
MQYLCSCCTVDVPEFLVDLGNHFPNHSCVQVLQRTSVLHYYVTLLYLYVYRHLRVNFSHCFFFIKVVAVHQPAHLNLPILTVDCDNRIAEVL